MISSLGLNMRLLLHDHNFFELSHVSFIGTCVATEDSASQLNTLANDLTSAIRTRRQHRTHGAFKTVKDMFFIAKKYFKTFPVFPTHLTTCTTRYILCSTHTIPLYLLMLQMNRDELKSEDKKSDFNSFGDYLLFRLTVCAFLIV
jgi:hypothetical protein